MRNWKFSEYNPKLTEVEFNVKNIPREKTSGIIIKVDNEDYDKKNIVHACIHLNGEIKLCLNEDMIAADDNYLIVKILVRNRRDHKFEGLRQIVCATDYLQSPQLDAVAWLCRKWISKYNTDNIIYEAGDMFPKDLFKKYIKNEGFTKYE